VKGQINHEGKKPFSFWGNKKGEEEFPEGLSERKVRNSVVDWQGSGGYTLQEVHRHNEEGGSDVRRSARRGHKDGI